MQDIISRQIIPIEAELFTAALLTDGLQPDLFRGRIGLFSWQWSALQQVELAVFDDKQAYTIRTMNTAKTGPYQR